MYKNLIREKYGKFIRKEGKATIILKNILELEKKNTELLKLFEPVKSISEEYSSGQGKYGHKPQVLGIGNLVDSKYRTEDISLNDCLIVKFENKESRFFIWRVG